MTTRRRKSAGRGRTVKAIVNNDNNDNFNGNNCTTKKRYPYDEVIISKEEYNTNHFQQQQQQVNQNQFDKNYHKNEVNFLDWTLDRFSTQYFSCGTSTSSCLDTCTNGNDSDDDSICDYNAENNYRSKFPFTSAVTSCTTPSTTAYNSLHCECSGHIQNDDEDIPVNKSNNILKDSREDNYFYRKTRKSLYRKTMMTAATINGDSNETAAPSIVVEMETKTNSDATNNGNNNDNVNVNNDNTSKNTSGSQSVQRKFQNKFSFARGFADDAGRAIGNLLPTASLQNITARKYTLPDKTVASQVLMYRQLLHTKCRPGLKLSRPYQGTPAQKAVIHMPWWEEGIDDSKKMIISYDNLITRLWLNGAIEPYRYQVEKNSDINTDDDEDPLIIIETTKTDKDSEPLETFITDGLPPVPHQFWVDRLGFQQTDPVTDFRSGGVLSLAMMVYMVESKPIICQRFFTGDTAVLPFGITCINVTDMIAKFLMLAKSTDRMDALLSQKPFWKMFADPNAITAIQELALSMLCDVAVELGKEKRIPYLAEKTKNNDGMPGEASDKVTVFDFSTILERTEKRVRDDLLGAGPKTVDELRSIAGRLRVKYQNQLDRRIKRAKQKYEDANAKKEGGYDGDVNSSVVASSQMQDVMDKASFMAGGLFAKVKSAKFRTSFTNSSNPVSNTGVGTAVGTVSATMVDLPPVNNTPTATVESSTTSSNGTEGDWVGTDIASATDAISNFSIGDDEDDDADLLL